MPITLIEQKPNFTKKVEGENKLAIAEMFCDTLQGEGFTSGVVSTFIRLQGCTLQCGWCFYEDTPIVKKIGKSSIKDIQVGEKLLTLDRYSNIVETEVKEVIKRRVAIEELLSIEFDFLRDRRVYCTKEHPFYVKDFGWKQAKDIVKGDIVLGPTTKDVLKYKAKANNNQFIPENKKKSQATYKSRVKQGFIKPYERTWEHRKNLSLLRTGDANPMKRPEVAKKNAESHFKQKSRLEQKFEQLCIESNLPIEYVGNNILAIGDSELRYRFPDFIIRDKKKVIECYDTTFQYQVEGKRAFRDEKWISSTQDFYKKKGYEVLFVNQKDLKVCNQQDLLNRVFEYCYNGSTVTEIKQLDRKQKAALFSNADIKEVSVFNLSCAPYNSYLLHGKYHHKWVHNCDTLDVWPHGNEYSFEEIFSKMESVNLISRFRQGQHLILTGGSPLKQQGRLTDFLLAFVDRYEFVPYIEVENEAVLLPEPKFSVFVDQWNNSPKLSNSGMKKRARIKPDVLQVMDGYRNSWFKFVIQREEDWKEIEEDFLPYMSRNRVILMPEGQTQDQLLKSREIAANIAIREGVRFTDRLHITIWDRKTGV